eukprot:COSAG02_NODE_567_length_20212_cov_18.927460_16_plen_43_part_00
MMMIQAIFMRYLLSQAIIVLLNSTHSLLVYSLLIIWAQGLTN